MAILFTGCATTQNREQHQKLRHLVASGMYSEAQALVKSDKFYSDDDSKLVKLLEEGTVLYLEGKYYQALKVFDKGDDLSQKLFTKSIKGKIKAAIVNSNVDKYYGEKYERSSIKFYQALCHYMLYQVGIYESYTREIPYVENGKDKIKSEVVPLKKLTRKERRRHLQGARASILGWDSILDSYRSVSGGVATYKDDLLAKIFGAFIHEQMGSRNDKNIAINLYKKAREILFKNYGIYKTFNKKNESFKENFSKFANMGRKAVETKFFNPTHYFTQLDNFLAQRIKRLKKGKDDNLYVTLQSGFIAEKYANKIHFPIPTALFIGKINAKKGKSFPQFVASVLGASHGTAPSITYELPAVKDDLTSKRYVLKIKDAKGKVVKEQELPLIEPYSEISKETLEYKKTETYSAIGARLAAKHIAALFAAYKIYESKGMLLATLAYAISNKAIAASELADLRYWSLLPKNIRMTSMKLPLGKYSLELEVFSGEQKISKTINLHQTVELKGKTKLVDLRVGE